jgi:serine/threonine protein kinase
LRKAGDVVSCFRLVEKLDTRHTADLWKAEDTRSGREVAIKFMPSALARDPRRLARLEELVRRAKVLDHASIVKTHALEEHAGAWIASMDYVDGQPLTELIPENGASLELFLEIAVPLTEAVRSAHEQGVLHGDLKPANVLIDPDRRPRILGFGLTEIMDAEIDPIEHPDEVPTLTMSQDDLSLSTVPYMSPEQIQGKPVDQRTDLFSLGGTLYQIATGCPPFTGESPADILVAILHDRPKFVSEFNPMLPRRLGDTLLRCLEKDPDLRFPNVQALRDELSHL